ncbi:Uncharacterised protein [uncultured Comamonas sp.]|nr:Uncharacterised protein [uncultured Comamonas sp.]
MRLLIALILPWLTFFTIGRPFAGIICLILQITLIGCLPFCGRLIPGDSLLNARYCIVQ